jgi:hypothetical protein
MSSERSSRESGRARSGRAQSGRVGRAFVAVVVAASAASTVVATSASARTPSAALAAEPPAGATKPNLETGIGTKSAMDDPRCTTGEAYGVYGRWNGPVVGMGPPCAVAFEEGDDNGGATSRGVTADSVKIVYVVPQGTEAYTAGATAITNRATGTPGTMPDAVYDNIVPLMEYYETWGRDLDITFFESSGNDEAAQRADAVAILALKPFIVLNGDTTGLPVLEAQVAKSKTIVFGYGADADSTIAQAPYRWGGADPNAAMVNAAEAIGKQLVGKKAEWSDSPELQSETRVFGLVYQQSIPIDRFEQVLGEYDGEVAVTSQYEGAASAGLTGGDATLSAQQAPVLVQKMKNAGVTTVVLAADIQMIVALMTEATKQNWFPEWFVPGSGYVDFAGFLKQYPADQVDQMFGLGLLSVYLTPTNDPQTATLGMAGSAQDWFWGRNQGSTGAGVPVPLTGWLMIGLHMAGPNLTPKTFERGLFAVPASGGSASDSPLTWQTAYGDQAGLPYPARSYATIDFAPFWLSTEEGQTLVGVQSPSLRYPTEGQRFAAGKWPTKKIPFFDVDASITHFDTRPASVPEPVRTPCDGCPSSGGSSLSPGAPDQEHVVIAVPAATTS